MVARKEIKFASIYEQIYEQIYRYCHTHQLLNIFISNI